MSLTLLRDDAIFLDQLPQGNLVEFLAKHPDKAPDYIAAIRARVCEEHTVGLNALREQLRSAHAAIDQLRGEHATALAAVEARLAEAGTERDLARAELAEQQVRLATAESELARLRGRYELPNYLLVVELPRPIKGADHAGIRGLIDHHWRGDLLKRIGQNEYAIVETNGYQARADAAVTSLSEVTPARATADAARLAPAKS